MYYFKIVDTLTYYISVLSLRKQKRKSPMKEIEVIVKSFAITYVTELEIEKVMSNLKKKLKFEE